MPGPWSHVGGHHRIEERDDNPYRLGRHVHHDPRSLAFQVRGTAVIQSVAWQRHIPILDQGQVGSCTGNAATGALASGPLWDGLQTVQRTKLNEDEAIALYAAATQLDPYPGYYSPGDPKSQDTGSDGLSVAKAAQKAGLISGYLHATSLSALNTALMSGPVIVGTNWYEQMFTPDSNGIVTIGGQIAGGHEYCIREYDLGTDTYTPDNSWGTGWGLSGRFRLPGRTLARLLAESGDCTQFVPLTSAPPVPSADPNDVALWAASQPWVTNRHIGSNHQEQLAVLAWAKAKGLTT